MKKIFNFIKTTKWWMYLPFACFSYPMTQWVFKSNNSNDRLYRLSFILLNTVATSIIFTMIILNYIV